MKISKSLLIILALFLFSGANAQLVNQPVTAGIISISTDLGQTFVAPTTTKIGAISLQSRIDQDTTLSIYDDSGKLLHSQPVSLVAWPYAEPTQQIITLDSPVSITANKTYTFVISGIPNLYFTTTNPYADGTLVSGYISSGGNPRIHPDYDLPFAIYEYHAPAPAVAAPKAIPATSLWTVLVLLSGIIMVTLQRRK